MEHLYLQLRNRRKKKDTTVHKKWSFPLRITVPGDERIELKEQRLRREMKKIWNLPQVAVFPEVIGAIGVT